MQAGLSTPSYTSNPAPSLMEKLGGEEPVAVSPQEKRLLAHNKKQRGEILSPTEAELAETYEWEHEGEL